MSGGRPHLVDRLTVKLAVPSISENVSEQSVEVDLLPVDGGILQIGALVETAEDTHPVGLGREVLHVCRLPRVAPRSSRASDTSAWLELSALRHLCLHGNALAHACDRLVLQRRRLLRLMLLLLRLLLRRL